MIIGNLEVEYVYTIWNYPSSPVKGRGHIVAYGALSCFDMIEFRELLLVALIL